MSFFKLVIRVNFICFLVLGLFELAYSQGCNGVGGGGISGGPISTNLGVLCANVDALGGPGTGAEINITAGNVFPGDIVSFAVFWDDASASPVQLATPTGPNTWELNNVTHYFPTTGPDVKCEYVPRVTLIINGIPCTANFGSSPKFTRWNVDNENTGILSLTETITDVNTYLVCKGTETTVTFTDRSTLNCVPPDYTLPNPINTLQRWRRFTYGTANTITSATGVEVNNVIQAYPFLGGVITANPSQNPLPPTVTLPITIPDDAQVGEEFEITMEYWNTCNPFPGTPVTETARIRVVDQPPAPTANNNTVCNGTNPLPDFSINIPGGFPANSLVTWFQDNANTPGAIIPIFTTSTLPVSALGVNGTIPGIYRVWASYFGVNNVQGISCESPRIPVTLTIRENLPIPTSAPPGYTPIICRDDLMTITLPNPPIETFGGPTEYVWAITGGGGVTFTSTTNSATFDFSGIAFGGADFVNRNIRVNRRYTTNPQCTSPNRNLAVQIFAPSVGGTLSSIPDICETSPVGTINLTGERGVVQRWEVSFNNGPFIPNGALGTATSISPGTVAPGNYRYQAIVANGTCAEAPSTIEELDVFPNPAAATVGGNQQFCKVTLDSNPLGGNTPSVGTGVWSVFSRPTASSATASNFVNASQGNTIFNGDVFGVYILRWTITSGICVSSDDIEIDFGTLPGPQDAGAAGPFCALSGALNAAAPPTVGTGQWSLAPVPQPGTAIFADNLDRNSVVTVSAYGSYTFRWTVTSGICASSADDVLVRFTQAATSSVPPDFRICIDQTLLTPIDLTGSNLVGGGATQGRWQRVSGSGTIQSSGGTLGNAISGPAFLDRYIPTAGETTVRLRMVAQHPDVAACPNVNSADLTITIDRRPGAAVAGTDFAICNGDIANLNANAATNGGIGSWTPITGVADVNDPTTTVTGLTTNTIFTWTVRSVDDGLPGACTATADGVRVTVRTLPAALDPTPNDLCETNEFTATEIGVTLAAYNNGVTGIAGSAGRTVKWYANGFDQVNQMNEITVADIINLQVLYTRVTDISNPENCESLGQVTFTVNPKPIVNPQNIGLCEELPPGTNRVDNIDLADFENGATTLLAGNRTITWHTSVADAEVGANPVATPGDVDLIANTTFYARVVNNTTSCFNVSELNLTIKPRPVDQTILGSATPCVNATELYRVNQISGAQYIWNIPPQFSVLGGGAPGDFYVLIEFPTSASGDIKVTIVVNGCAGNELIKPVTVSPVPSPFSIIPPPETICEGGIFGFKVSPDNTPSSTYNWQILKSDRSPGGGIVASGQTTGEVLINVLSEDIIIRVTENNASGCAGPAQELPVVVNKRPIMANLTVEVCSGDVTGIILSEDPSSPVVATTFKIQVPTVLPGISPVSGPTIGTVLPDGIQNDSYKNQTSAPVLSLLYRVTPISSLFCEGEEKSVIIDIKAEPLIDPNLGRVVCSDEPIEVTLKSAIGFLPADKFEIQSIVYNTAVLTPLTPLPSIGTLVIPNEIYNNRWENITNSNATVIYNVRPYSSLTGCYGNPPAPIAVIIQPKPLVTPVADFDICSGDVLSQLLTSSNVSNATFTWTAQPDANIIGSTGSSTNTITDRLFNTSLVMGSVLYEVRATNPSSFPVCSGPPTFIRVNVRPSPPITSPLNKVVCSDAFGGNTFVQDLTLLNPEISVEPGVTYTWFTDVNDFAGSQIPLGQIAAFTITDEIPVYVQVLNPAASSGCAKDAVVIFDVRPTPQLTLDPEETADARFNITCNGLANGLVVVSAQFGTNHTFSLDGGSFVPAILFSNLSAGNHIIRTKNTEGCFRQASVDLIQPDPILPGTPTVTDVSCFNDPAPDGQINITATGGTSMSGGDPLLFSLLQDPSSLYGNPIAATFSALRASTYTVKIEDKNGCTKFVPNIIVTQPIDITISIGVTSNYNGFGVSCEGEDDGQVTVLSTTGGAGPYTYALDQDAANTSGFTTGVFNNLIANVLYSITVTDSKGCPKQSLPVILKSPLELFEGVIGFDRDVCEGADPISFVELAPAFGGNEIYTYLWEESPDNVTFGPAAGVNNLVLYDPPVLFATTYYHRVVFSSTCNSKVTEVVKVVVHPLPVPTLDAPPQVCEGGFFTLDFGFTQGQAPYFFDYTDGTTVFSLVGSEQRPVPVINYTATKTFTLTRLRDFYGCEPTSYPPPVTPAMINMNTDFTIAPNSPQCSGGIFTVEWTVNANVEYVWAWNDGSMDEVIPAIPMGPGVPFVQQLPHSFTSANVGGNTVLPVTLTARSTILASCFKQSPGKNITIYPAIFINAVNDKSVICSGEKVKFINSTLGGSNHHWFYRVQGTVQELEPRTFATASTQVYTLRNTTTTDNPIIYEVVYQVSNGTVNSPDYCSDEIVMPIRVYREMKADFNLLSPTTSIVFTGGNAIANFENVSTPLENANFQYVWDFGTAAVPGTLDKVVPDQVRYTSIGPKDVTLIVTNRQAEADGFSCFSDTTKTIFVILPDLVADFRYTPQAACFPVDIVITENLATGDTYQWKLFNITSATPLLVSNDSLPTFRITNPGTYFIELKTSNSITGQTDSKDNSVTPIEIFDVPFAAFEARPPIVFIPDEKVIITNRSADASDYDWDFDDGETSTVPEPAHFYALAGKYTITLVASFNHGTKDFDGDGIIDGDLICYDTARQEITAKEGGLTRIPNAFTPNTAGSNGGIPGGGSFNDVFIPITKGVEEFEMTIFDRWGNLIFQSTDKGRGWDGYDRNGVLMPAGVYVYKLTMRLSNDQRTTQIGDVTLIR